MNNPYTDDNERITYAQGYADGYMRKVRRASLWVNAYNRGYWDGYAAPRFKVYWSRSWAFGLYNWPDRIWELQIGPLSIREMVMLETAKNLFYITAMIGYLLIIIRIGWILVSFFDFVEEFIVDKKYEWRMRRKATILAYKRSRL